MVGILGIVIEQKRPLNEMKLYMNDVGEERMSKIFIQVEDPSLELTSNSTHYLFDFWPILKLKISK